MFHVCQLAYGELAGCQLLIVTPGFACRCRLCGFSRASSHVCSSNAVSHARVTCSFNLCCIFVLVCCLFVVSALADSHRVSRLLVCCALFRRSSTSRLFVRRSSKMSSDDAHPICWLAPEALTDQKVVAVLLCRSHCRFVRVRRSSRSKATCLPSSSASNSVAVSCTERSSSASLQSIDER